jgi:drug/metabolite transporter (DMT)-like permease
MQSRLAHRTLPLHNMEAVPPSPPTAPLMTPIALLLLAGTSLCWAAFDAARKGLAERVPLVPLVFVLSALQMPLFGAWLWMEGVPGVGAGYGWAATTSVVLNIAANLLFLRSVSLSPLSVTVPLLSLTPVFSAIIALVLMGEMPSLRQWAGICVVVAGALVLNARTEDLRAPGALLRSMAREPGAVLMAAVALLWSVTSVVDKIATEAASAPLHALVQVTGMAAGVGIWLAVRREGALLGQTLARPGLLAFSVVAAAGALGLQLLAFTQVLVSIVETTKRAVGMTSALVIGRIAFGETITPFKVVAVLAMAAGAALILL